MRKTLLVLGICCVLAAPAWAGGGFSLFGSYSEVSSEGQALGFGGRVTIGGLGWVGDLSWTWYPTENGILTIDGIRDNIQITPLDMGFRYIFKNQGSFKPYLGAGATFFWVNLDRIDADNAWGGYAVAGFNLGRHRTKFFAEVLYRFAESNVAYRHPSEPVWGKMDVGGFAVNAGLNWGF